MEGRNLLEDLGVKDVVRQTVAGEDDEVVRLDLDGVVLRVVLRGISRVRAELEGLVELWTIENRESSATALAYKKAERTD